MRRKHKNGSDCDGQRDAEVFLCGSAMQSYGNFADRAAGRRKAGCDDSGLPAWHEHTLLWNVQFFGKSAGGCGNCRSPRSIDAAALQYGSHGDLEYDQAGSHGGRKTGADKRGGITVYGRNGQHQYYICRTNKSIDLRKEFLWQNIYHQAYM